MDVIPRRGCDSGAASSESADGGGPVTRRGDRTRAHPPVAGPRSAEDARQRTIDPAASLAYYQPDFESSDDRRPDRVRVLVVDRGVWRGLAHQPAAPGPLSLSDMKTPP
jgi:hypothetical protein